MTLPIWNKYHNFMNWLIYSKTCVKLPLSKTENLFSIPIIAQCRSKVLPNAPRGAFCHTSLSYDLSLKFLFCLFLSGHFTQVLLYNKEQLTLHVITRFAHKKRYLSINFLILQPKHMLWVLKTTFSVRKLF